MSRKPEYIQKRPATTEEIEQLIAGCYPVVREHVEKLERTLINRSLRKWGKKLTEAAAHELIIRLIAATGGDILEVTL